MTQFRRPALAFVILFGVFTGATKLMELPQDVALFQAAGLSAAALSLFGAFQVCSAALMALPRARRTAAILLALCFFATTVLVLQHGAFLVGLAMVVPVWLTLVAGFWRKPLL